ncbi:MAG: hypothetical protein SynsKO_33000 [Synoicihabitans sp.]
MLTSSRNWFVLLWFFVGIFLAGAKTDVLVHQTTTQNLDGHLTVIDDPTLNGKPERLLFITQRFGTYNPHEVGVWYDKDRERWTIYNEDAAPMPADTQFNVLAVDPGSPYAFTHSVNPSNVVEYYTTIAHPSLDHNPGAMILTTPNYESAYVPSPIGVWYTGTQWSIFRQDKKDLNPGVRFNVLVVDSTNLRLMQEVFPQLSGAFIHQATPSVTRGNLTFLRNIARNDIIFATHNWGETGPYNQHVFGTWHNAQTWALLNHDRGSIENNARFNVVIFSPDSSEPAPTPAPLASATPSPKPEAAPAVPQAPELAALDFVNRGAYTAFFTLEYFVGSDRQSMPVQELAKGTRAQYRLPTSATAILVRVEAQANSDSSRSTIFEKTFPSLDVHTVTIGGTITAPSWIEQ